LKRDQGGCSSECCGQEPFRAHGEGFALGGDIPGVAEFRILRYTLYHWYWDSEGGWRHRAPERRGIMSVDAADYVVWRRLLQAIFQILIGLLLPAIQSARDRG
jgi:hypothetical protein